MINCLLVGLAASLHHSSKNSLDNRQSYSTDILSNVFLVKVNSLNMDLKAIQGRVIIM